MIWKPKQTVQDHVSDLSWAEQYAELAGKSKHKALKNYYREGMMANNTRIANAPLVALDFETTGLDNNKADIISIGLVPFDLNRIYLRQGQHWLVKPKKALKSDSVVIHGITHSELQHAPDIMEILPQVLEAIAGKICVVHYRKIEREFFDTVLRARIQEGIRFPVIDTLQIEWDIQQQQAAGIMNRFKGKRPGSVRLANSRRRYNLPTYTAHDALVDAIATAELLQAQIAHHFSPDDPISDFWL